MVKGLHKPTLSHNHNQFSFMAKQDNPITSNEDNQNTILPQINLGNIELQEVRTAKNRDYNGKKPLFQEAKDGLKTPSVVPINVKYTEAKEMDSEFRKKIPRQKSPVARAIHQ